MSAICVAMISDDGPGTDALTAAIRKGGRARMKTLHIATDHSWSDARVPAQAEIFWVVVGIVCSREPTLRKMMPTARGS